MNKKTENLSTDLKNLNLEGLVKEAKEKAIAEDIPAHREIQDESELPEASSFPQSWNSFLFFLKQYKSNKRKQRDRSFYIENEIIDVLENCSIEKSKTTDIINGILRSFIDENKSQLRASLRPRPTLISLD